MARIILALLAMLSAAAAFAPSTGASALRTSVVTNAYVPDGLTPDQWKAQQAKEAKKKADNKKFGWGVGRTGQEKSLTEFQAKRDAKYPNTPGAGHMWAKAKFFGYRDQRVGGDGAAAQSKAERNKR